MQGMWVPDTRKTDDGLLSSNSKKNGIRDSIIRKKVTKPNELVYVLPT